MIKVGIEVPDQNFSGIDLSQPELGNPGWVVQNIYLLYLQVN